MRSTSRRVLVALGAAVTLLVGACAAEDETNDGSGDGTASEPSDAEEAAPEPEVLRFGFHIDSDSGFDPHRLATGADLMRLGLVYDFLLVREHDGLEPGLAKSWGWDGAGEYLELELQPDVTFQDGEPFDAEAVRASLERAQELEGSTAARDLARVSSIEVVDDLTVRLHTTEPDALLEGALAYPNGGAGAMISPAAIDNEDLATAPVGAGQYRLGSWDPGVGATFEAWDDYWRPEDVALAGVELVIVADAGARLNALRTGEIDLAIIDAEQIEEASRSDELELDSGPGLVAEALLLNRSRDEFGDERVRQAVSLAIDREAIGDALHFGQFAPSAQWYAPGLPGHADDFGGATSRDVEGATALLAEAGYEDGFDFEALVPSSSSATVLAEVLQAQLEDVGIGMDIRQVDISQLANLFYVEDEGDAALASPFILPAEPLQAAMVYLSPDAVIGNPGGHTTPAWQELLESAGSELDPERRQGVVEELLRRSSEEVSNVIIGAPFQAYVMSEGVEGFARPLAYPDLRGVSLTPVD